MAKRYINVKKIRGDEYLKIKNEEKDVFFLLPLV